MDGLLKEAQHSKPASAKPSKTLTSSERESSPRSSGKFNLAPPKKQRLLAQPDLSVPHVQNKPKRPGVLGLVELNHQVD